MVRANTLKRRPREKAFIAEELLEIQITPAGMEKRAMLGASNEDDGEQEVVKLDRTEETLGFKRLRINKEDFDEIGLTDGCPGCNAIRTDKPSQSHTESCRRRVERHLGESREGRERLE